MLCFNLAGLSTKASASEYSFCGNAGRRSLAKAKDLSIPVPMMHNLARLSQQSAEQCFFPVSFFCLAESGKEAGKDTNRGEKRAEVVDEVDAGVVGELAEQRSANPA